MWRRSACQTLSKAVDISSVTAWVAPNLVKVLVILSHTTVRRSVVDQEDLGHTENQEKGQIFLVDQQSCYLQVLQRLFFLTAI